jgi:peptidoglycan/LPS O-acetylase OafA/YrhL
MRYRQEIDGLRAVAVLPVILFHAGFDTFSGGFIGVDVFFVISGYLITTIIYGEIQEGSFSIIQFYERRARRIFPALFVVSLACIPFAWIWMMPSEFEDFSQSLVAVNFFVSNILFMVESGYFAAAAELKPLLHTWSLALEEQFYVFFPLFLLLFCRLGKKALFTLIVVLTVCSLGLAVVGSRTLPTVNFYILPTRAWELGVGAILAFSANRWSRTEGWVAHIASFTGLGMILYAIFMFDETVPFPGWWGLVPVMGTALVIAYARPQSVVGRLLGWRPFVWIGLISYSAYLWHQPLFAFARIRLLDGVSSGMYLGLSVATLGLAYVSWRYVEKPFRNKTKFSRRQLFYSAYTTSVLMIAFGLVGSLQDGIPDRITPMAAQMAAWADDEEKFVTDCSFGPKKKFDPDNACKYGDFERSIFIWGDSHARALTVGLKIVLNNNGKNLIQYTSVSCAPVLGYEWNSGRSKCLQQNKLALDALLRNNDAEVIVLDGRWAFFFEHSRFDNLEGGVERGPPAFPVFSSATSRSRENSAMVAGEGIRATIRILVQSGKKVVLVYPVPEVGWNVPGHLAREIQFGVVRREPLSTSYEVFKERTRNAREQLDMVEEHPNLVRIIPDEIFCNTYAPGRCIAQINGQPLYYDDDHLNSIGAAMLSERIVEAIRQKGWF